MRGASAAAGANVTVSASASHEVVPATGSPPAARSSSSIEDWVMVDPKVMVSGPSSATEFTSGAGLESTTLGGFASCVVKTRSTQ